MEKNTNTNKNSFKLFNNLVGTVLVMGRSTFKNKESGVNNVVLKTVYLFNYLDKETGKNRVGSRKINVFCDWETGAKKMDIITIRGHLSYNLETYNEKTFVKSNVNIHNKTDYHGLKILKNGEWTDLDRELVNEYLKTIVIHDKD